MKRRGVEFNENVPATYPGEIERILAEGMRGRSVVIGKSHLRHAPFCMVARYWLMRSHTNRAILTKKENETSRRSGMVESQRSDGLQTRGSKVGRGRSVRDAPIAPLPSRQSSFYLCTVG